MQAPDAFLEHYRLLGLEPGDGSVVDEAAIKKAYRKKALELHPDKNRDNPNAEALFDAVKKASEALLDKTLRAEFEKKLAARAATAARFKEQDESRRKLREALEAREKSSSTRPAVVSSQAAPAASSAHTQEALLARLRADAKDRQRELEISRALGRSGPSNHTGPIDNAASVQVAAPAPRSSTSFDLSCAVRVKWSDEANATHGIPGGVDENISFSASGKAGPRLISEGQLTAAFERFGAVLAIISKKDRSACVVFEARTAADAACASPPASFYKVSHVVDLGSASGEAATQPSEPRAPFVGQKRSRYDEPSETNGTPAGARQPPLSSAPAQPPASFASKEADTLRRMMEAAAARKKAAAAAAASATAADGGAS